MASERCILEPCFVLPFLELYLFNFQDLRFVVLLTLRARPDLVCMDTRSVAMSMLRVDLAISIIKLTKFTVNCQSLGCGGEHVFL